MKRSFYLAGFLAAVACLAALLLTAVNSLTAPIIKENEAVTVNTTLKKVFPKASSFTVQTLPADCDSQIISWYKAEGYGDIFQVSVTGYNGKNSLVFMVGIDYDGVYSGFTVISNADSPGFGQRLTAEYAAYVNGLSDGKQPDVLTGATRSSKAVQSGLQAVYDFWLAQSK